MTNRGLLSTTAFIGLILTGGAPAFAQSAGPEAATSPPQGAATAFPATSDPFSTDIVVTARKRQEKIEDVPIAVSVLSGAMIAAQGIKSVDDIYGRIPSLYFTNSGGAAPTSDFIYLVIRGVGFNGGQEPSAGVFIDGMYQPQLGFDVGFLDLERLEVLRGPQGTLFGRNTEAGALNLVTRKPGSELEGRAEVEGGKFGTFRAFGTVRGPISPIVSAGLTAEYSRTDGFATNPAPGGEGNPSSRFSVRGVLRVRPSSKLDIVLTADTSRQKYNELGLGVPLTCNCYRAYQDNDRPDYKNNSGVQLNADWDVSPSVKLTSITGYRDVNTDVTFDFDGRATDQTPFVANGVPASTVMPAPVTIAGIFQRVRDDQRVFSQELRLAGSTPAIDWLLGGYYFSQKMRQRRIFNVGNVEADPAVSFLQYLAIAEDFRTNREGEAAFGQLSWRPVKALEFTGGLRYSFEKVSVSGERVRNITQIENASPTFFRPNGSKGFGNLSWMGSATYKIDNDIRLYGTVSRGWKAGGFNRFPSKASAVLPYDSETSTNYEVGLKSSFANGWLTANLAAFIVDINGMQQLTVTPDASGVPVTTIANAGKSRSKGFEAELTAAISNQLHLSLSGSYTHARFVDFLQCAAANVCVSRNGQRFEFVPEWEAAQTLDYRLPIGDDVAIFTISNRYISKTVVPDGSFLADLAATIPVPSYDRVDLRVGYQHKNWKLTGYVTNLFNSFDYTNAAYHPFLPETPQNKYVVPLAPRTFGAVLSFTF